MFTIQSQAYNSIHQILQFWSSWKLLCALRSLMMSTGLISASSGIISGGICWFIVELWLPDCFDKFSWEIVTWPTCLKKTVKFPSILAHYRRQNLTWKNYWMKCPTCMAIYIPVDASVRKAIVYLRNPHNHPMYRRRNQVPRRKISSGRQLMPLGRVDSPFASWSMV